MRSHSLGGTRPANTSASVPRLMPLYSALHHDLALGRRAQRFAADLAAAGRRHPECSSLVRHIRTF